MSERGVFAVDRGIFEHPKFKEAKQPLSKLEAWMWLLSSAAWKPHTRRVSGRSFELKRGQLVASTRYMAERWRWSEAKVRRFLDLLKTDADTDAEIDAVADAGVTVITIRKYDQYQRVSLPRDADTDADIGAKPDAVATQERRNKEDIQDKEDILGGVRASKILPVVADGWPADYREQFWAKFPNKVGKPKALAKLDGCRKRRIEWPAIIDGLDRYIRTKPPDRPWLNPETFLNQERWADQPAAFSAQGSRQNGRRTVHDAADDLLARVRALDEPAPRSLCDGTGEGPVRLLPSR